MRAIARWFPLGAFLLLGGYASSGPASAEAVGPGALRVCTVMADPEAYVGVDISIKAAYRSDGRHFEYLLDTDAKENGLIDIGRHGSAESVGQFYAAKKQICATRGSLYLCNLDGVVTLLGRVRSTPDGYFFDVQEVQSFEFEVDLE